MIFEALGYDSALFPITKQSWESAVLSKSKVLSKSNKTENVDAFEWNAS